MRTADLTGHALDWAVCVAEYGYGADYKTNKYSTDWAQGGPIIEREKIGIVTSNGDANIWVGSMFEPNWKFNRAGHTPLIAAMRCYVASKLGDEVAIPSELTQGETK